MAEEVDACIGRYNRALVLGEIPVAKGDEADIGKDGRVWSEGDEEVEDDEDDDEDDDEMDVGEGGGLVDKAEEGDLAIAIANMRDPDRKRTWGRIIEVGHGWERRDTGDKEQWYCALCPGGRSYKSKQSAERHLDDKHKAEG